MAGGFVGLFLVMCAAYMYIEFMMSKEDVRAVGNSIFRVWKRCGDAWLMLQRHARSNLMPPQPSVFLWGWVVGSVALLIFTAGATFRQKDIYVVPIYLGVIKLVNESPRLEWIPRWLLSAAQEPDQLAAETRREWQRLAEWMQGPIQAGAIMYGTYLMMNSQFFHAAIPATIAAVYTCFEPRYEDGLLILRVMDLIIFPVHLFVTSMSALPEQNHWPRCALIPIGHLFMLNSFVEHSILAIWTVLLSQYYTSSVSLQNFHVAMNCVCIALHVIKLRHPQAFAMKTLRIWFPQWLKLAISVMPAGLLTLCNLISCLEIVGLTLLCDIWKHTQSLVMWLYNDLKSYSLCALYGGIVAQTNTSINKPEAAVEQQRRSPRRKKAKKPAPTNASPSSEPPTIQPAAEAPCAQPAKLGQPRAMEAGQSSCSQSSSSAAAAAKELALWREREAQLVSRERQLDILEEAALCAVCLERAKDVVLLPCRHLCLCFQCADGVTSCPMCRESVVGTLSVYN